MYPNGIARKGLYTLSLTILMLLPFICTVSGVEENYSSENRWLKFSLGMAASYAIHESAHALTATFTNTDISWESGIYNQPIGFKERADKKSDGLLLNASGLFAQVIASEVILNTRYIDKKDAFVKGVMTWNIINPMIYAVDYWLLRSSNRKQGQGYQGDIQGVEYYSDKTHANQFAFSMALIAAVQGYRFYRLNTLSHRSPDHPLLFNAQPLKNSGFQLTITFHF